MSFRWKLLFAFGATTLVAVAVVALVATRLVRASYVAGDQRRIEQVLAQAQSAIKRRGEAAVRRVSAAAESEAVTRIGIALNQAGEARPEEQLALGSFLADAAALAHAHELELLQIVADDGTVLSSAQWEARAGYREPGIAPLAAAGGPVIRLEELPSGPVLAVEAVRELVFGTRKLYLLGGYRLDDSLVAELSQAGVEHVMLYRLGGGGQLIPVARGAGDAGAGDAGAAGASGSAARPPAGPPRSRLPRVSIPVPGSAGLEGGPQRDAALEEALRRIAERAALGGADYRGQAESGPLAASHSTVAATPIRDARGNILGAFVVTVSGAERAQVIRSLYWGALIAGMLGLAVALLLSVLLAQRITAPVDDLVRASRELAAGNLGHRIHPRGDDELARLAAAFNNMAASLQEQSERLVQAERVAAWRELARRLAHELKNPLFPLQLSIENLRRARQVDPGHFDEAFEEGTTTLLAELEELKRIVARFSDFARMPQPQREPTDLRALLEKSARVYEGRIRAQNVSLELGGEPVVAQVDPHLFGNALSNLVLNALDAMPAGGRLELHALRQDGRAVIEVADTGQGLTAEEQQRLFTPYYTTKRHGTGLGLAIVQSVVADHGGRITVESEPQRGTRFRIELPVG